jgi:peptidoglycan LD-endopeptidase LytH
MRSGAAHASEEDVCRRPARTRAAAGLCRSEPTVRSGGRGFAFRQPHRGAAGPRPARIAVWAVAATLLLTIAASAFPVGFGVTPANASSLSQAKSDLSQAQKELKALQTKLDKLAKQQSDAEADLEVTQDKITEVQGKIDAAQQDLAGLRTQLYDRLSEMYKNRSSEATDFLNVLFAGDETSLASVIGRLTMVSHIAQSDSRLVNKVVDRVADLNALKADLKTEKTAEMKKNSRYEAAREKTLASLEDSKDEYNALKKKVARLKEAARQAEIAAKQAEVPREAADAAKHTTTTKHTTGTTHKTTTTTEHSTPPVIADFVFPVDGPNSFSDTFGAPRSGGRTHQGCDIFTARNNPLVACVTGTITSTSPTDIGLGGITIHLKKGNTTYYYAHLSSIKSGIKAGVHVEAGQVIGYAGNTGNASGGAVHLHFEIRPNGVAIDPYPILIQYR